MTSAIPAGVGLPHIPGFKLTEDPTVPVDIEDIFNHPALMADGPMSLNEAVVLLMLRKRTSDLDAQVHGVMRHIEEMTEKSEKIQKQIEALQQIESALAGREKGEDYVQLSSIMVRWGGETVSADVVLRDLGLEGDVGLKDGGYQRGVEHQRTFKDPDATASEREAAQDFFDARGWDIEKPVPITSNMKINASSLRAVISRLESESRRMNGGNELQMVRMQSAMQQRSQVITMGTQMIKSMADTNRGIARNI